VPLIHAEAQQQNEAVSEFSAAHEQWAAANDTERKRFAEAHKDAAQKVCIRFFFLFFFVLFCVLLNFDCVVCGCDGQLSESSAAFGSDLTAQSSAAEGVSESHAAAQCNGLQQLQTAVQALVKEELKVWCCMWFEFVFVCYVCFVFVVLRLPNSHCVLSSVTIWGGGVLCCLCTHRRTIRPVKPQSNATSNSHKP
jgi:hypothetical protein